VNQQQAWAVILAGGDGTRLRPITRVITGEDRPKQFCRLYGGKTLLAGTRARLADAISPDRTVYAVVKAHERYYAPELADVHPSRIVVQPVNRGTTAAIVASLRRIRAIAGNPVVGFFPTDHHYARESKFLEGVLRTLAIAGVRHETIVLLGAGAEYPETEYGWIEPGETLSRRSDPLFGVRRFWEKPTPQAAAALLVSGCLWNTFVMIGRASAFEQALAAAVPNALDGTTAVDPHAAVTSADFSRDVLANSTAHLAVYQLADVGWSDLGTPARLREAVARYALDSHDVLRIPAKPADAPLAASAAAARLR